MTTHLCVGTCNKNQEWLLSDDETDNDTLLHENNISDFFNKKEKEKRKKESEIQPTTSTSQQQSRLFRWWENNQWAVVHLQVDVGNRAWNLFHRHSSSSSSSLLLFCLCSFFCNSYTNKGEEQEERAMDSSPPLLTLPCFMLCAHEHHWHRALVAYKLLISTTQFIVADDSPIRNRVGKA